MITDEQGNRVDTFTALLGIVAALDRRFPDGNAAFARVSRLCEEAGELAAAVNHAEGMGIKHDKHGEFDRETLVKEIQDVLRAAIGVARHFAVEDTLEESIEYHYRRYQRMGYRPDDQTR